MSDLDLFDTLLLEVDTARGELGQPAVAQDLQDKLQQVRRLSQRLGIAPETAHGAAAGGDAGGMTNLSDEEEPLFQGQEHAGGAAGPQRRHTRHTAPDASELRFTLINKCVLFIYVQSSPHGPRWMWGTPSQLVHTRAPGVRTFHEARF